MRVKIMTEQHLEFLSLKGGCIGSSGSTLVKMPHCWKSHVVAHLPHDKKGTQGSIQNRTKHHKISLSEPNFLFMKFPNRFIQSSDRCINKHTKIDSFTFLFVSYIF